MEITPTTAAAATTTAQTRADDTSAAANAMAGDFQTFLKLLTTQMRNQDPLKPMESTEFVAQLASFSAVEQQIRSNDRLDHIAELLSGGSADGLATWIGRNVRAPATAAFDGSPVDVEVTPVEDADRSVLVVRNDFNQEVARLGVTAEGGMVAWNGTDNLGNRLPNGRYGFKLESYRGEELLGTQDGRVFTTVSEVRIADGTPMLVVEGGGQVALDAITGIR
jgi:flagellar basal-body rod modification protein FlgD